MTRIVITLFLIIFTSGCNKNSSIPNVDFEEIIDEYEQIANSKGHNQEDFEYYSILIWQDNNEGLNIDIVGGEYVVTSYISTPSLKEVNALIGYKIIGTKKIVVCNTGIKDKSLLSEIKSKLILSDPKYPIPPQNGHWDPFHVSFVIDSSGIHEFMAGQ